MDDKDIELTSEEWGILSLALAKVDLLASAAAHGLQLNPEAIKYPWVKTEEPLQEVLLRIHEKLARKYQIAWLRETRRDAS